MIVLRKAILCSSSCGAGVHLQPSLPCAGRAAPATHTARARLFSPPHKAQHLYNPQVSFILKMEMFRKEKHSPEYREIRFLTDLPPVQRCDTIRQTRGTSAKPRPTSATLTSLMQKGTWGRTKGLCRKKNPGTVIINRKFSPNKLLLVHIELTVPVQMG